MRPTDSPLYPFTYYLSEAERALKNDTPGGALSDGWHLQRVVKAGRDVVYRFNGLDFAPLVAARKAHLDASPSVASMKWERFIAEAVKLADAAIEKES